MLKCTKCKKKNLRHTYGEYYDSRYGKLINKNQNLCRKCKDKQIKKRKMKN